MEVGEAFRGLADQALALETASEQVPAATPAVVAEPAQPASPAPVTAPSQEIPATPQGDLQPVDLSPDTPVRIKVDGVEKVVKMSEYKEILQRTDVFTQRQQALARAREELAQHYAQREAQLQQAAQQIQSARQQQGNPVEQLVQALQQSQTPQRKTDPNEIATLGEVQQMAQALAEQYAQARQQDNQAVQQLLEQRAQQVRQELEVAQDQKKFSSAILNTLSSEDGQLLAEVSPEVEAQLRYRTLQMGPESVDQAIEFLGQITKEWAGKVRGKFTVQQKQQEVAKALNVMEAPSGAPVPVAKSGPVIPVDKYGNVNIKALQAQALSLME
jgi:hypothetical protein